MSSNTLFSNMISYHFELFETDNVLVNFNLSHLLMVFKDIFLMTKNNNLCYFITKRLRLNNNFSIKFLNLIFIP